MVLCQGPRPGRRAERAVHMETRAFTEMRGIPVIPDISGLGCG